MISFTQKFLTILWKTIVIERSHENADTNFRSFLKLLLQMKRQFTGSRLFLISAQRCIGNTENGRPCETRPVSQKYESAPVVSWHSTAQHHVLLQMKRALFDTDTSPIGNNSLLMLTTGLKCLVKSTAHMIWFWWVACGSGTWGIMAVQWSTHDSLFFWRRCQNQAVLLQRRMCCSCGD